MMRRGAFAYESEEAGSELEALADAAKAAAERSGASIDDALAFTKASNERIALMEAQIELLTSAALVKRIRAR